MFTTAAILATLAGLVDPWAALLAGPLAEVGNTIATVAGGALPDIGGFLGGMPK